MARTLRWVVDQVTAQQGGPPATITATHPANWGPYKLELFHQAMRLADLGDASMLAEPVAAAAHYASQTRMAAGAAVAVYDLGGGTFDAAVVRRTETGFELLGEPEGIEHLGGDFSALDPDDANVIAAVARLWQECVDAKEALSTETAVSIPVLLPQVQTQVELTRAQVEQMVRPALGDTIGALQRAIHAAGLSAGDLTAVLLVGGSSRIPLVAQLVTEALELGDEGGGFAHPTRALPHEVGVGASSDLADEPTERGLTAVASTDLGGGDPGAPGEAAAGGWPLGWWRCWRSEGWR